MLSLEVHPQGGPAAAQLTAMRVRAGHLRAHVHGQNVLAHIALSITTLGAENTGPQPSSVFDNVTRHGGVDVRPRV